MAEVILALDQPDADAALALVERIPGLRWVKVGSTLFGRTGPGLIRRLGERGLQVFLDLKWHDIPHQVAGAVRAAAAEGVALATVHALGGRPMLEAAVEAAGGDLRIAAVTVLTSHAPEGYAEVVGRDPGPLKGEVERLARLAAAAGVHALVSSPHEAAEARRLVGPDRWIVVPGIRPDGSDAGDQRRTGTPAAAAAAGASHLVVGRPIAAAADPADVFAQICQEVA